MSECEKIENKLEWRNCDSNKYEEFHKLIIQYICEKFLGYTISQACLKGIECSCTELKGRCTQYTYTCKSDDICFRFIHCPKNGLVDISCYLDVEKHELKSNELTKFTKKLIKEIIKGLFYILFGMFDTIIDNDADEEKYNEINLEIEVNVFEEIEKEYIKVESTKTTAKHYRDNNGDMHFTSIVITEDHHNQGDFKAELFIMEYICDEYPCDEKHVEDLMKKFGGNNNYKTIVLSYIDEDDKENEILFGLKYNNILGMNEVIYALLQYMRKRAYETGKFCPKNNEAKEIIDHIFGDKGSRESFSIKELKKCVERSQKVITNA